MKRKSSSPKSKTNYRRLKSMKSGDVLLSAEHPEADLKHIVGGIVRRGLKVVPPKSSISLRVDSDVLNWFRATGAGYQSRMNAVFESIHARAQNFATTRAFDLQRAGEIDAFLLPYLDQKDDLLADPPLDLVRAEDVADYPTDFSAMSPEWIDKLAKRVLMAKGKGDAKDAAKMRATFVDSKDQWAELRATITERWLRASKASFVYSLRR